MTSTQPPSLFSLLHSLIPQQPGPSLQLTAHAAPKRSLCQLEKIPLPPRVSPACYPAAAAELCAAHGVCRRGQAGGVSRGASAGQRSVIPPAHLWDEIINGRTVIAQENKAALNQGVTSAFSPLGVAD